MLMMGVWSGCTILAAIRAVGWLRALSGFAATSRRLI